MSDIDIAVRDAAHEYVNHMSEPLCMADINDAFVSGAYFILENLSKENQSNADNFNFD